MLLAQEHGIDLSLPVLDEDISPSPISTSTSSSAIPVLPDLLRSPGSSSGSYLHSLILTVARTYPHPVTLESKAIRSADYVEHTLRDASSGASAFRGATCYGFRNLQNVIRRVGRSTGVQVGRDAAGRLAGGLRDNRTGAEAAIGRAAYDYVEVMACPGGCVGGGGQLRGPKGKTVGSTNHDAEGFVRDCGQLSPKMSKFLFIIKFLEEKDTVVVLYRLFPSFPMSAVKRCDPYELEVSSTVSSTRPAATGAENDTTTPNLGTTRLATRAANPGATRLRHGTLLRRFRHRVRPNHRPTSQPETRTWNHGTTTRAATLAANRPATFGANKLRDDPKSVDSGKWRDDEPELDR